MNFHLRLKQLRQKKGLTQGELAGILGLKPTAISNYESNRNEPSFEKLIALSKEFDVTCDYLLGVSDSALPIGGEILDKEIVDFFLVYQQLMPESAASIRDYAVLVSAAGSKTASVLIFKRVNFKEVYLWLMFHYTELAKPVAYMNLCVTHSKGRPFPFISISLVALINHSHVISLNQPKVFIG